MKWRLTVSLLSQPSVPQADFLPPLLMSSGFITLHGNLYKFTETLPLTV